MVSVDLDIKGIIGLLEIGNLPKKKASEMLNEFNKDQLIEYIISSIPEDDIEEDDIEED